MPIRPPADPSVGLFRLSGLALVIGGAAFILHIASRSVLTSEMDLVTAYRDALWVPINVLGVFGALLVLLGLPAMYARMAGSTGLLGLAGVVLISLEWIFFGVFLSLFAVLVAPWLAGEAPALVGTSSRLPAAFTIAFVTALLAWLIGAVLLAIPLIRGGVRPRWVGVLLPISAMWAVAGDLIAPSGPSTTLAVNLLSNLGPVLLVVALGRLGAGTWTEQAPTGNADSRMRPPAA